MRAFLCEDLKGCTSRLFTRETFDHFLVRDASLQTFCRFTVEGRTDRDWYPKETLEEERIEDYTAWSSLRPVFFSLIRGSRLPRFFRITFRLPPEETEEFLKPFGFTETEAAASGLMMNVKYEAGKLSAVSAVSVSRFPPDKEMERAWDSQVQQWFRENGIAVRAEE